MAKIKFTADSTCDLPRELADKLDLTILNFFVLLGDKGYRDGIDIFPQTIFEFVEKQKILPKTAAPSPDEYRELFSRFSSDYDAVIHFNISSKLSASNQNANIAVKDFKNVYVIDSAMLSTGTSMLIFHADKLRKEGKSAEEIVDSVNKLKYDVQCSFIVDTLEYLHKGGRCSGLTRFAASVLKLHPVLLLKDGAITVHSKLRGKIDKVYSDYIDILKEEYPDPSRELAIITHTCDEATMKALKDKVQSVFNFKTVYVTSAGSTITSHCGKGTWGIMFYTK